MRSPSLAIRPALARPSARIAPAAAYLAAAFLTASLTAQKSEPPLYGPEHVAALKWRGIGPSNMSGRITDLEMLAERPATIYAATAGGGVWRTRNNGTTWDPLFQHQPVASIGDVAVARSNPDVVWVGTGEENGRNSVSFGDGVYKSTDGGDTWQHMGLAETFQIGNVAIHPHTADTVFVAALGTLWGPNTERGVFRTTDGGATWDKVLYLDEWTGCIDVRIDPQQPDVVFAAMYERARDEFDTNDPAVRFGDKAGFFKSTDGGDTWTKLTAGLPSCRWGRSAIRIYEKDPAIVYAMIETERSGWATGERMENSKRRRTGARAYLGVTSEDGDDGVLLTRITKKGPAAKAELKAGDTIVQIGETTISSKNELNSFLRGGDAKPDEEVTVTIVRAGARQQIQLTLGSRGGTRTRRDGPFGLSQPNGPYTGRLGGQHPNVQDDQGELGYETGGVFRSEDHGETWTRVNSLTERPFYYSVFAIDPNDDQNLYVCGVLFQKSEDGGKEFKDATRGVHVDFHAVVVDPTDSDHIVLAGDGGINTTWDRCEHWEVTRNLVIGQFYHADVDNSVPYRVYGGLQDNGTWGGPSRTRSTAGIGYDDWVQIYGGDGFIARADPEHPPLDLRDQPKRQRRPRQHAHAGNLAHPTTGRRRQLQLGYAVLPVTAQPARALPRGRPRHSSLRRRPSELAARARRRAQRVPQRRTTRADRPRHRNGHGRITNAAGLAVRRHRRRRAVAIERPRQHLGRAAREGRRDAGTALRQLDSPVSIRSRTRLRDL